MGLAGTCTRSEFHIMMGYTTIMKSFLIQALCFSSYIFAADVCDRYPCHNDGVCESRGDSSERHCTCQLGYSGQDCSIDVCGSKPCLNGGTCVGSPNSRDCLCPLGFNGDDCSIDVCKAKPCRNGATCLPIYMWRQCICPWGYAGDDCSEDLCQDFCQKDGQCIGGPARAYCICQPGWTGKHCEDDTCDPNPCYHGRECHDKKNDFHCHCVHEGGRRCEYNDVVPFGQPLLQHSYILPDVTKNNIYVTRQWIHTTNCHVYGIRVVGTGKATPFNFQILRRIGKSDNFTLVFNQRITLSPKASIQEVKFTDHGIQCGKVKSNDHIGLYFPEGSDGVGLHRCAHDCGGFILENAPANLSVNAELAFRWHNFKYHFGIKAYFALEGEFGRRLDSNSCPENTELPDAKFGDPETLVQPATVIHFAPDVRSPFPMPQQPCSSGGTPGCKENIKFIVLVAVFGTALLISLIVVTGLVIKLRCHSSPPKAPSTEMMEQQTSLPGDGYSTPYDNGSYLHPVYTSIK